MQRLAVVLQLQHVAAFSTAAARSGDVG